MSLQLILGNSGSGKSYSCYQNIIKESIDNPDKNYIILVPEQFTLQTQKDIVTMHPNKGIFNIDILSFDRLAYRIFDEVGGFDRRVLEDTGKSMVLRKVVENKKDELTLFNKNIKKTGFIDELKSTISEFYQYDVSSEELTKIQHQIEDKPMLYHKLKDLQVIYDGFKDYLSEHYITSEEILDILSEAIEKSNIIKNSIICLDGYTGFTPIQYKLLERLMKYSQELIVTITIDWEEDYLNIGKEFELFNLSKKTITKLMDVADIIGVPIKEPIVIKNKVTYRHREQPALAHLEKQLFRFPFKSYDDVPEGLSINIAKNPQMECEFVAKEIIKLVKEGYRYKEIAIVTGSIETYSNVAEKVLSKYRIPFFIDNKRNILSNPFVELIRAAIEVITNDFSYESVFRYLRTGLTDVEQDNIDILENYVLALGIRGNKTWQKKWDRKYKTRSPIDIDLINQTREEVIAPILELRETFSNRKANVKQFTEALYNFIVSLNIHKKLDDYSYKFERNNELLLFREYQQIYKMVMELFDKMVDLLGEEVIPAKEYLQILEAGFAQCKMGLVPPGLDQIVVGDIERTRLKDIKALFFIGVNDGIIPKSIKDGGIISDIEKQMLQDKKMELAPDIKNQIYIEQFYIYLNLTKPQSKLYISFSKIDSLGKSLRFSYLIGRILKLFPNIKINDIEQIHEPIDQVVTPESSIDYLIQELQEYKNKEMSDVWKELYNWYIESDEWKKTVNSLVEAAFHINSEKGLTRATAKALYGEQIVNNVTRLEKYAACAFAHFVSYGMDLLERQEYRLYTPDIGNLFHNSIEYFSKKLTRSEYDWNTITDDKRDELVEITVREVAEAYGNTILLSSARNEYLIQRLIRITKRTIWALQQHIKKGKFKPSDYEIVFSSMNNDLESLNIKLDDNNKLQLTGVIDRLDKYEDNENIYLKIIDYKSGNTSFDISALYYGLQLQLAVYMNAAMELERESNPDKTIIPAGIFYYNIKDPLIDKQNGADQEDIEEGILDELRMNGLSSNNIDVIKLMDKDINGKSSIIPVAINKDGSLSKTSSVASVEQFNSLSKYVNKKIAELGAQIIEGNVDIKPYKRDKSTACDYCQFSSICQFDLTISGNQYNRLRDCKADEIWERIGKEINEGKEVSESEMD